MNPIRARRKNSPASVHRLSGTNPSTISVGPFHRAIANAITVETSITVATILMMPSNAPYLPMARIDTHTTNSIMVIHSCEDSIEKRCAKNPAVTNITAPVTKNIVVRVAPKNIQSFVSPRLRYPSMMLVPVAFA